MYMIRIMVSFSRERFYKEIAIFDFSIRLGFIRRKFDNDLSESKI